MKGYLIGETSYIHEGNIDYLYKMVDELAFAKVDAIKFHLLLNLDSYMERKHPLKQKLKKWMFTEKEWTLLLNYTNKKGLDLIALCDDVESIKFVSKRDDIKAIEIHATSLNDYFVLKEANKFYGTVMLGVGGSTLKEIEYALKLLKDKRRNTILMHGFQAFPTDYKEIQIQKMRHLQNVFKVDVGYADHTSYNEPDNVALSCIAAANGFFILEKHFSLNEGEKRIDYESAIGKEKMIKIKELMEKELDAYFAKVVPTDGEINYGKTGPMKKAIVARKDIPMYHKITEDDLWFKRTEREARLNQSDFPKLLGKVTLKKIYRDELLDMSMVKK